MFVCVRSRCLNCGVEIVDELPVGHGADKPSRADVTGGAAWTAGGGQEWLGDALLSGLQSPNRAPLTIKKEVREERREVVILNCLDFLYGHCLLKLLNAERHLDEKNGPGLIVIVPRALRWLVPDGAAEIWTVDWPLGSGQAYFPAFDAWVQQECRRFARIWVSRAYSHPKEFRLENFTKIAPHGFGPSPWRVTFIWREDRLWCPPGLLHRRRLRPAGLRVQNARVRRFLSLLRHALPPETRFSVAGLGQTTRFPEWIDDQRVDAFTDDAERALCRLYADSRLVVGLHGSNMLLPSGQAGMTLDLMPENRWTNFAQDILFQESDPRRAAFRYRFLPQETPPDALAAAARSMLTDFDRFAAQMSRP